MARKNRVQNLCLVMKILALSFKSRAVAGRRYNTLFRNSLLPSIFSKKRVVFKGQKEFFFIKIKLS